MSARCHQNGVKMVTFPNHHPICEIQTNLCLGFKARLLYQSPGQATNQENYTKFHKKSGIYISCHIIIICIIYYIIYII